MPFERPSRPVIYLMMALICLALAACSPGPDVVSTPVPAGKETIDPVFREFYRALGGEAILGPAISQLTARDAAQCQYTLAALMCFDQSAPETGRFALHPIGRELGERDTPRLTPPAEGARVVDGLVIYQEFVPLYDRLHGARYVGRPLTEVRINYQQRRIEQYFENVGFYRLLDVPDAEVRLIAYGSFACGQVCSYHPQKEMAIIGGQSSVEQPIARWLIRVGGVTVWGQPLTEPYMAPDGSLEQVYEKAVFYIPAGEPRTLRLRPAALMLGTTFTLPARRNEDSRMVFYPVEGDLGYNVPRIFDQFLASHGGSDLSGPPISELVHLPGENLYRQCFQNYCIDYDHAADPSLRTRLAPIGIDYIQRTYPERQLIDSFVFSNQTVGIEIGEARPQIAADEAQEIFMVAQQRSDRRPITDVEGDLTLYLPGRDPLNFHLPPTGANGVSSVWIPPQPGLENGSLVPYQVCLNVPSSEPICAQETYLIWNLR